MRARTQLVSLAFCLVPLLNACEGTGLIAPISPLGPTGVHRYEAPPASGSHSERLGELVAIRDTVYLTGTWDLESSIDLDSNTQLIGESPATARIRWNNTVPDLHPLYVRGGVHDVAVKNITFEGVTSASRGYRHQFALKILGGTNITFQNNHISGIAMVGSYGTDDLEPTAADNFNIRVLDNITDTGMCGATRFVDCSGNMEKAIELGFVDGFTINGNHISNFSAGIGLWGGDPTGFSTVYRTHNGTIQGNVINQVSGGIVIIQSDNVDIYDNFVQNCSDTCLDVEGGYDVLFAGNTAEYGSNYVFSAFWNTEQATFRNNTFEKGDGFIDENGVGRDVNTDQLYYNSSSPDSSINRVDIRIHDNVMTWVGSVKPFGKISLSHSWKFLFSNNQLTDIVIELAEFPIYAGSVLMEGDSLHFTKSLSGRTALHTGYNNVAKPGGGCETGPTIFDNLWHVLIAGVAFSSAVAQPGVGIKAEQSCADMINTLITGNKVRNFATSIQTVGLSSHHFAITKNGVSGGIDTAQSPNTNVTENYSIPAQ